MNLTPSGTFIHMVINFRIAFISQSYKYQNFRNSDSEQKFNDIFLRCFLQNKNRNFGILLIQFFFVLFFVAPWAYCYIIFPVRALYPEPRTRPYEIHIFSIFIAVRSERWTVGRIRPTSFYCQTHLVPRFVFVGRV